VCYGKYTPFFTPLIAYSEPDMYSGSVYGILPIISCSALGRSKV